MVDIEEGCNELFALGREQTTTLVWACRAIMALSTIMTAQQDQLTAMRERMVQAEECLDAMREMILALEHTQENPIVVDDEEMVVSNGVEGEELEVEENKVAVPIPPPGWLVPIKDMIQVLPNELVSTQIAFELANKDRPPSYK